MTTLVQKYIPRVAYDDGADILYIKYGTNKGATAREIGSNIIVYLDDATMEPRTITILDFKWLIENCPGWESRLPVDFNGEIKPLIDKEKFFS